MTLSETARAAHVDISPDATEGRLLKRIFLGIFLFLAGWGGSVVMWGIPGLYLPALALVPVMYIILILISRG